MTVYDRGLAVLGYDAYGRARNWKTHDDKPMPRWEELPEPIQEAWTAAATAIADALARAVLC